MNIYAHCPECKRAYAVPELHDEKNHPVKVVAIGCETSEGGCGMIFIAVIPHSVQCNTWKTELRTS